MPALDITWYEWDNNQPQLTKGYGVSTTEFLNIPPPR